MFLVVFASRRCHEIVSAPNESQKSQMEGKIGLRISAFLKNSLDAKNHFWFDSNLLICCTLSRQSILERKSFWDAPIGHYTSSNAAICAVFQFCERLLPPNSVILQIKALSRLGLSLWSVTYRLRYVSIFSGQQPDVPLLVTGYFTDYRPI